MDLAKAVAPDARINVVGIRAGEQRTTSDSETVRELVEELQRRYGSIFGKEVKKTKILVNGYAIQFYDYLDTKLKSGDTVDFLQNWRVMEK